MVNVESISSSANLQVKLHKRNLTVLYNFNKSCDNLQQISVNTSYVHSTSQTRSDSRPFVDLFARPNGTDKFSALYDTGAQVSLLQPKDFQLLLDNGAVIKRIPFDKAVLNASGQPMATLGCFIVRVIIQKKSLLAVFIVSPEVSHSIIGMNIITDHRLILDPLTRAISFGSTASVASLSLPQSEGTPLGSVVLIKETTLPARHGKLVQMALVNDSAERIRVRREMLVDLDIMAVAVATDEEGRFSVHLPNADLVDRVLERGRRVGVAYSLNDWTPLTADQSVKNAASVSTTPTRQHSAEQKKKIRQLITDRVVSTVPYQFQQDYIDMLVARDHCFSADSFDLGLAADTQHSIELDDRAPAFSPQFRLPYEQLKLIQENVAGWLQAGIVQRAKSPYNSPIFCVPKKTGQGMRCVLDYRKLNSKTLEDKYSIRTIDECIEQIGRAGSSVFSALDLTNGYWQLKLRASDRPFTAFTIPGKGQFQWVTTPQGLMGAPASFARLMDHIMADAENVITYLDDVLIHSKNHRLHLKHLCTAVDRIGAANLRLNPAKCTFGASKVEYLGHTLTDQGIRPGTDKAKAVAEASVPSSLKQLRSFLGLANYFRQYIPNYSRIASPLHALTQKDSAWKNGPLPSLAERAFHKLKSLISSRPLMAYPNSTGTFHLYVDACLGDSKNSGGLGACLLQDQPDGSRRPVGYASRRLNAHEKNYPAFLCEMQAAVYGMEFFDHYLRGARFLLYTDHKPMVRLSTVHTKTLSRLRLKMLELHPEIRHVNGSDNPVADFLSRYDGYDQASKAACSVSYAAAVQGDAGASRVELSASVIKQAQLSDQALSGIIAAAKPQCINSTRSNPVLVRVPNCKHPVTIIDGMLMILPALRQGFLSTQNLRIALPNTLRTAVIERAHASRLAGHSGSFKTAERVKELFWWPNIEADVQKHLQSCNTCLSITNKGVLPPAPNQFFPPCTGPNQRIHADLFGPLKSESHANSYVLVVTDAFSKFVRLTKIDGKDAITVAQALVRDVYVFGCPKVIVTDQGNEFCNELQQHLWRLLDIEHRTTTPYHPQCNGQAEVFNKTIKHYLATAILDANDSTLNWELYLGPLAFSYNTAIHAETKVSPFFTQLGYPPRVPLWAGIEYPGDDAVSNKSFAEYLGKLKQAQHLARQIVHHNIQHSEDRRLDQQMKQSTCFPSFEVGDLVWVKIQQKVGKGGNEKLQPRWEPGVILARKSVTTYYVERTNRSRKKRATLNVSMLKPRLSDSPSPPPSSPTRITDSVAPSQPTDNSSFIPSVCRPTDDSSAGPATRPLSRRRSLPQNTAQQSMAPTDTPTPQNELLPQGTPASNPAAPGGTEQPVLRRVSPPISDQSMSPRDFVHPPAQNPLSQQQIDDYRHSFEQAHKEALAKVPPTPAIPRAVQADVERNMQRDQRYIPLPESSLLRPPKLPAFKPENPNMKQIHMRNRRFYDYSDQPESPTPVTGPIPHDPARRLRRSDRTPVKNKRYLVSSLLCKIVDAIVEHCNDDEDEQEDTQPQPAPQSIAAIVSDLSPDLQQLVYASLPQHLRSKTHKSALQMSDLLAARQHGFVGIAPGPAVAGRRRAAAANQRQDPPAPLLVPPAQLAAQEEFLHDDDHADPLSDSDQPMPTPPSEASGAEGGASLLPSRSSSSDSATSNLAAEADDIAARRYLQLSHNLKMRIREAEEDGKPALQRHIEQTLAAAKEKYLTHAFKRLRRRHPSLESRESDQ